MPSRERELVLIGHTDVGKTAMVKQMKEMMFVPEYVPTVDEVYCMHLEHGDKTDEIAMNDVSGANAHNHLRNALMLKCEGIVGVYSITSAISFAMLQSMIKEFTPLAEKQGKKLHIIIVGCKSDLESQREVDEDLGRGYAKAIQSNFMEISAKNRDQVVEVFTTLLNEIDKPPEVVEEEKPPSWVPTEKRKIQCCSIL